MNDRKPGRKPGVESELTDHEKAAFRELAAREEAGEMLKTRIVHALRDEGLIEAPPDADGHPFVTTGRRWLDASRRSWLMAAAAAIVFFVSGMGTGHVLGSRATAEAVVAARDAEASAANVQRWGSSYVAALRSLETTPDGAVMRRELTQSQEVARAILFAAALELERLDPSDPRPALILRALASDVSDDEVTAGLSRTRTIQF